MPRKRKVVIRAIKNISPGEEINYDYGTDYFKAYLKPIGSKCDACERKRKKKRAEARAERLRLKAKAERKALKKAEKQAAKARERLEEELKLELKRSLNGKAGGGKANGKLANGKLANGKHFNGALSNGHGRSKIPGPSAAAEPKASAKLLTPATAIGQEQQASV